MPRRVLIAVLLLTAAVLAGGDLGILGADDGPPGGGAVRDDAGAPREGRVTRVVDGDTIVVGDERVRLIGVDTPESVKPGTPVQCFAKKASAFTKRLVAHRRVRLEYDVERRDRYGRLLAYVRRVSGGLLLNAELVGQGYARTLTIPPNVRYADRFAGLARRAREERRGLWRAC